MKLLITGVHGFVGSNLVNALSKDYEIYGLDIISPQKAGVIKTYTWDDILTSQEHINDFDAIIHLAGKAHDTKNKTNADIYFQVNTELTKKIYDFFLQSSAKKFVFFSSVKAAADVVEGDILTENITPKPVGPYGESKIAAEKYIQERILSDNNKKLTYILRPCMIHGPGNKGNLNLLYNIVSKGIPWPLGAFENRRTFTSIDNLCYIINNLLIKDVKTGIYNMNDDEAISTNELIEIICTALGKKAHIWKTPKGVVYLLARIGDIIHLPLNTERLKKLTENYIASNKKIKDELGISKMPIRAKDGLNKTILSFSKEKNQ